MLKLPLVRFTVGSHTTEQLLPSATGSLAESLSTYRDLTTKSLMSETVNDMFGHQSSSKKSICYMALNVVGLRKRFLSQYGAQHAAVLKGGRGHAPQSEVWPQLPPAQIKFLVSVTGHLG